LELVKDCVQKEQVLIIKIGNMQKKEVLDVQVRACRRPRFKAGSDLSGKVNRLVLDINQTIDGDQECVGVNLKWVESADASDCDGEI